MIYNVTICNIYVALRFLLQYVGYTTDDFKNFKN